MSGVGLAEKAPAVLFFVPVDVAVTFTLMVHDPEVGSVPPARLIEPVPAVAVTAPPHVLLNPFGVDTTNPEGSVSEKAMAVSGTVESVFVIVKVRLVDPPTVMLGAPNALVN